ncbi:MAG TPA: helix-turn-helix transcriptional regulator [Candidatus Woesebacteria bacterium]|jgi:predicted transcriptional regulator|nr:helix-turn-helix transcriptional regulator [Candidatus Woesebacteria bacterium]
MDNWEEIKKNILKENEVKKIYDNLEVEYQIIGDMVRLRNKNRITQKELAKKIGTTQSALSRFEMGNVNPSLDFLKKIARALGTKLTVRFG